MERISMDIARMKNHYTVVVVGSGYGGGVAASRMSRAKQSVCVLERGKEMVPGQYPNSLIDASAQVQIDSPQEHIGNPTGLYDFRLNPEGISVFSGCGLGGTSLINANVSLRAELRVFQDQKWPAPIREEADRIASGNDTGTLLAKGYELAEEMLRPVPYPDTWPTLPKLSALEHASKRMSGKFYRLPINVTFEDKINHVGVEQHECVLCGDCVTGCNYGAKNSVLMNYLPDARNHGAEIFTQVAVRYLERKERQWLVHYEVQGKGHGGVGSGDRFLTADIVILAGNALGSTEILLRSRQYGLQLSPLLGKGFTGNGDVIGFSYNGDVVIDGIGFGAHSKESRDPVGPCITGIIDLRGQPDLSRSMVIEEASIPGAIAALLPEAFAAVAALENRRAATAAAAPGGSLASGRTVVNAMHRELESVVRGPYHGAVRHTQTLAIMTHDDGDGEMYLEDDRLRIRWPGVGDQPIFQKAADMLEQVSEALGGRFLHDPVWGKFLHHHLVTVHPMGGCIMGDDVEHGVVNHKSQVFDGRRRDGVHEGLYVCDGSVVPRSLGVNPLLTISALAERSCCLIAEEHGWTVNYTMPSLVGGAPCT